jgi:GalNAc-alpha-(1->4)-GalNAc-alpha-(1->3)-diNAcBac-PP-undecaprenol alpha-1,4-N-acetyl-D-galactosaminyltransferase
MKGGLNSMKILLMIDNLNSGGAQRQIVNLAIGLKEQNFDVSILTYTYGNHFQKDLIKKNIDIIALSSPSKLKIFFKLLNTLRAVKPDVICAYLFVPSLLALLSKLVFWRRKVFVSERFIEHLITDWAKPYCRFLYIVADGIVANSATQTKILQKKYSWLKGKIYHIPNCVDTDFFKPKSVITHSQSRSKLNLIGIGRIVEYKNLKVLIEALNILKKEGEVTFSIKWIGREYEEKDVENVYYRECIEEIQQKKLERHWEWLGKRSDVNQLYTDADLLVHPSYGEGFPNVVCEALASALPVIASDVIDHPSIIKEGYNGFLFNPSSSLELADKITHFNRISVEDRSKMQENCRASAIKYFSSDVMISSYIELFRN